MKTTHYNVIHSQTATLQMLYMQSANNVAISRL